ncbi:bifunctional DNA-formamidopyrimidine glycosylase/DNA-(apurinic or apyrimidinic site) lyase [Marinihelvus fidelis]|uniref:Formamidopyrimidine-DNA glycosylase n=1 Tax=Marinihelvus fidelis TaxID=2613842 RepID=A0A5N0T9D2_9GAMM|nr:bifunctional DNA-formamidopyrimidine glycosylase/DNA-(apurinic or apyrimidinic site) lyase [Marinihelvus fidelis]KAA9131635.1 bifunctional DNA-formamidopyrimidine glycosylase/DNA-(apurinic or apyrimidinic site) lyase [Marinihelvus fidelis]
MPELPEVETTRRGIAPWLDGAVIERIVVRDPRLRWPVADDVHRAEGQRVTRLARRAKYLLVSVDGGALMLHLGMSGSVRVLTTSAEPGRHDHVDIVTDRATLRFNDPRRFGSLHWVDEPLDAHALLRDLGPEPLGPDFDGDHLWRLSRGARRSVKTFIMDGKVVVGVGNIYASEALYMAGIHPTRHAGRVSRARYDGLAAAIRDVLGRAIEAGGTTLRDFSSAQGTPGYFAQDLLVYDREGQACFQCGDAIRRRVIGQRASYYCPRCQR